MTLYEPCLGNILWFILPKSAIPKKLSPWKNVVFTKLGSWSLNTIEEKEEKNIWLEGLDNLLVVLHLNLMILFE